MKKQNFIDWIDSELNVIGYEHIERGIFVNIKRKVESGYFDKQKKSNHEKLLDYKFKALGIKPYVYHFFSEEGLETTFSAVTIATNDTSLSWKSLLSIINDCFLIAFKADTHYFNLATKTLKILKSKYNIYGVAICDTQDNYSKRYGRMKAKGKLFQHLIK